MRSGEQNPLEHLLPVAGVFVVALCVSCLLSWSFEASRSYFPLMPEIGEDPAQNLYSFREEYSDPLEMAAGIDLCSIGPDILSSLRAKEDATTISSIVGHQAFNTGMDVEDAIPGGITPTEDGSRAKGRTAFSTNSLQEAPQGRDELVQEQVDTGISKSTCLKKGQTVFTALKALGVDRKEISALIRVLSKKIDFRRCRPGDKITVFFDEGDRVVRLVYDKGLFVSYEAIRTGSKGFQVAKKAVEFERRVNRVSGTFSGDLYSSFARQGLGKVLAAEYADIFSTKVDFNTEMRLGDSFSLIYEEYWRNGMRMGYGRILAATYNSVSGTVHTALFFKDPSKGIKGYFTPDGTPFGAYFLRSPLKVYRVTSRFTRRRYHPVLKVYRPHYGVDLAAPRGTPVMAVADGVVSFVGWQRGYGRIVSIDHPGGYRTYYGHLSRFGKGIRRGVKVSQRQVIGYVGQSGFATGPHLDYRVKKNGRWVNPFGIKVKTAAKLDDKALAKFREETAPLVSALSEGDSPRILAVEKTTLTKLPDGWAG